MNIIIRAVFLISFGSSILSAQDFQGIATYKTKDKIEIELDSTQAGGMHDEIMAMLQKQFEKTYVLSFDQEQSVYKEDEELATPSLGSDMIIMSSSGTDILYKNIKDERYTKQSDFLGKIFLIQDTLQKIDWKLHADTKNIGKYACFKATTEGLTKNPLSQEPTEESRTITAWYTPQIPVSNGPGAFQGLPGLILELSYDSKVILCSKIILNPKSQITIQPPTKGKSVSQSEYDEIVEKKMKEMSVQSNGKGNGVSVEIEYMD
jgi:GLPGLI family protein